MAYRFLRGLREGERVDKLKIFAGNSNQDLAREICSHLALPLGSANVKTFSDGEVMVEVGENVRGRDAFIIQSIMPCNPIACPSSGEKIRVTP